MMKWLVVRSFVASSAVLGRLRSRRASRRLRAEKQPAGIHVRRCGVLRRRLADPSLLHLPGQVRSHREARNRPEFSPARISLGLGRGKWNAPVPCAGHRTAKRRVRLGTVIIRAAAFYGARQYHARLGAVCVGTATRNRGDAGRWFADVIIGAIH